jgi:inhibitor of KinA sporulation pathway (predicted exonuclease)
MEWHEWEDLIFLLNLSRPKDSNCETWVSFWRKQSSYQLWIDGEMWHRILVKGRLLKLKTFFEKLRNSPFRHRLNEKAAVGWMNLSFFLLKTF